MLNRVLFITIILFAVPAIAWEQEVIPPKKPTLATKVVGSWKSKKMIGACSSQINWLAYEFDSDGYYEIEVNYALNPGVPSSARGTYEIKNSQIIGNVDGMKIGPFDIGFEGELLVIHQTSPNCKFYLEKV